jgi:GPH family glycoside/pentoside/hexuronide:cation symporter
MSENEKVPNNEFIEMKYPSKIHLSYALGSFLDNFIATAFIIRVIGFYETEVFLPVAFISLAYIIYGIFNAINDPIIGYFSDRNTRFTKRWGRRYPWFAAAVIPSAVIYLFIFTVPSTNTLTLFFWLLLTICLYDLFYSIWGINWLAIFPDKFRSNKERTKVGGLVTLMGLIGMAFGMILPPLFIKYGDISSYVLSAFIVIVISIFAAIFMFPGMREDHEMIQRALRQDKIRVSFLKTLKFGVRQKNFAIYLFVYLSVSLIYMLTLGSLYYWVRYLLRMEAEVETYISAGFLLASVVSVPFWIYLARKFGNRKVYMLGALLTSISYIPLLIITGLIAAIICAAILSFATSSMLTLLYPFFSDVIDDLVVKTGNRQEGVYTGIRTFFGRLSLIIGAIVIAIVHILTDFDPEVEVQSDLALWGIRIIMALIPMIFCFVAFLLLWRANDLTLEKVKNLKIRLKEMNL